MQDLSINGLYLLHGTFSGKMTDHYTARFNGYEFEHDGDVKLAAFTAEMDGSKVLIDTDFVDNKNGIGSNWTITPFEYK